ncbi:MAG: hypothetical protein AAGK22_29310 [Acidobacteriota bacterium]
MGNRRLPFVVATALLLGALLLGASASVKAPPSFGALIEELSEEGGYFDTDNLISNERSYVRVVGGIEAAGGVYVGVGPEQNFNFIARRKPEWAFIVDMRRDNMVQHLLLGSLMAVSETPEDYLRALLSLPPAEEPMAGSLPDLLAQLASEDPSREQFEANLTAVKSRLVGLGVALSSEDQRHLSGVYDAFYRQQLDLRFTSHGRGISRRYPSFGELVAAQEPGGGDASFLATQERYDAVRSLVLANRLVPVVGNFAGPEALRRIGDFAREQELEVTTFYTSNVEDYLLRDGVFARWAENVLGLPLADDGLFVRAYFDYGMGHPDRLPGHRSATVLQRFDDFRSLFASDGVRSYWHLCTQSLRGPAE